MMARGWGGVGAEGMPPAVEIYRGVGNSEEGDRGSGWWGGREGSPVVKVLS